MMRVALGLLVTASLMSVSSAARAGGMDLPDNGTEALGRGGAFTAKADDPTAIYYNVAGLAQQRGTRLLANANVSHSSLSFERAGVYPGDPATQPYAGKPFAPVDSQGGISTIPFLAITSDFGLENATFALGTFAPPAVGGRVYPITTPDGRPGPARYDAIGGKPSLVLFHTAAAAIKLGDYVEVGLAAHVVQIEIGTRLVNYMTLGDGCKANLENQACDARGEATTKAWSGTGSLGAMFHPREDVSMGFNVKGPTKISAQGVAELTAPKSAISVMPTIPPTRVALKTELPWVFRAGARKTFGDLRGRRNPQPTADLEVDATYELWGQAMNPGPEIVLESVPTVEGPMRKTAMRGYRDTFSVRVGGSLTPELPIPVTLRGGAYYDSSATDSQYTRLDTDTLDKVALTVGAGLRFEKWHVDVAYASVFDVSRNVDHGAITSSSAKDATVVNEGVYRGHTHVASLGITLELDLIAGSVRLPPLKRGETLARR